ncbi:hypothetical protein B0A50_01993 [Salinomyces thailandicus]|uniref:Uncharacterized protein n=1 Tax=Salinomyces thailandicus TaxID=706561 RepID=A0A4U0U9S6_9PEZI|nr:hypothetical protein B0A50_01993 [Salinomyces thailandica]
MAEGAWTCTTGTYPIARDMRGMRLESVELLQRVIQHGALRSINLPENKGLQFPDVAQIDSAMAVVACHPVSAFEIEQSYSSKVRRWETWSQMEQKLREIYTAETE